MIYLFSPANHLLELARRGKRLPHVIIALVMTLVIVLLAQFTGGVLAVFIIIGLSIAELGGAAPSTPEELIGLALPDTALEQTLLLVLGFGPIFLVLWAWLALVEKRPMWTIGIERDGALFKYARGLLVGLLLFGGAVAISAALGYIEFEEGPPQKQGLPALWGVLLVFAGWVVQGAAEEALTRGWLMPVIGARYKAWLGVLLSSLVFAGLHSLNPNLSLIAVLNLFLFGFFAALYALYEGGLWGVFSIHTIWNWLQGNVLGFEVSGNLAPGGTLFNLREVGPDAITGGAFGPEGGLAVTIALLAGIAGVVFLARRGVEQVTGGQPGGLR